MIRTKTFTSELKAFHAMRELSDLDSQVNNFIQENQVDQVISVSDTCTTAGGDTIGIIRVLVYKKA
jgi:hypothetical protein